MGPTFHLESGRESTHHQPYLLIRGWAFAAKTPLRAVRLRLPAQVIVGAYGLPRPDVLAAHPEAAVAETGFELRAFLPAGTYEGTLELIDQAGQEHQVHRYRFRIRRLTAATWALRCQPPDLVAAQLPAFARYAPRPLKVAVGSASAPRVRSCPKLSIVTPSFQQRAFVGETLQSVLREQTNGVALEYVVRDGGSTDGSVDVIRTFEGRLTSWKSEPDRGQADAIVKGFAETSGAPEDLMAWINSDDVYAAGALRFVADFFAAHPDVDVVYGNRILIDEQSREIGRWYLPKHDPNVLRLNDFVPQETLFWRRRVWDQVGGLDPSFRFAMDWDLLLRFQETGAKIIHVPHFLGCFRLHAAQKTSAQIQSIGQAEIDRLRRRTFGRGLSPAEIEHHPALVRYLRQSAWLEFMARLGWRGRAG